MRVYVVAVKGKLLLLRTDDRTALQLDNGEISMDEAAMKTANYAVQTSKRTRSSLSPPGERDTQKNKLYKKGLFIYGIYQKN